MKEVFFIAMVMDNMQLQLLAGSYDSYQDAVDGIKKLSKGFYQVQKFFEVI